MITLVTEQGGQVLAERYVPLDARRREFAAIAEDIRKRKPDVVFCTVIGEAARLFYEACREAGLDETLAIASLTITEAEVAMMGPALAAGHLTAATYFQSIDSPENARFLAAYARKFGSPEAVNAMTETAYSLTRQVLAAVGKAGSARPEAIKAALGEMAFDAPQGRIRMDPDNSHFYLWPRIGRLSPSGGFDIVEAAPAAVKPDPYLVRHSIDDGDPSFGLEAGND
jgi:branched-chain amino acid transport system substrate-binding protein